MAEIALVEAVRLALARAMERNTVWEQVQVHYFLGRIHFERSQYDVARSHLEQTIRIGRAADNRVYDAPAADLLAQMADRLYLEKLLFLYHELREAKVGDYEGELDLLRKTIDFYDFVGQRLKRILNAADRYMKSHLASRWGIQRNLYKEAIQKHENFLRQILKNRGSDPRDSLKRGGIVETVRRKYGDDRMQ